VYSVYGKPSLEGGGRLQFNLSHSGNLGIAGISLGRDVGIDVERTRLPDRVEELVRTIFSRRERLEFESLKNEDVCGAFFRGWTRKEAYIKGRGLGLSIPLASFDVSLAADAPVLLLADRDVGESKNWVLVDLPVPPGYAAALAIQGRPKPRIKRFNVDLTAGV